MVEFEALIDKNPTDPGLTELIQIVLQTDVPISYEKDYLTLLLKTPPNNVSVFLAALERLIEVDPLRENEWKAFSAERLLPLNPERVGTWLNQHDGMAFVIDYFSLQTDPLSEPAAIVLVEACINANALEEAHAWLEKEKAVISQGPYAYLKARTYTLQGMPEEAWEFWQEAHSTAMTTDAFPLMKNLGILAIQIDQPITALQSLYTAFSAGIPFSEEQAKTLLGLTLNYGTLQQSIKVAAYLNEENPDTPLHQNNLAYFNFLAETNLDQSVELMRTLVEEYPEATNYRLTLALGLLKIGRINEANRLLQNTSIDWKNAGNRAQLIYAVVLSANNQRVVAEGLLQNIDEESLIPEEKALLEGF